jgi:hypothetical protein
VATVEPDPRLVGAYDELRASVRPLVGALDGVAALFEQPDGVGYARSGTMR